MSANASYHVIAPERNVFSALTQQIPRDTASFAVRYGYGSYGSTSHVNLLHQHPQRTTQVLMLRQAMRQRLAEVGASVRLLSYCIAAGDSRVLATPKQPPCATHHLQHCCTISCWSQIKNNRSRA